MDTNKVKDALNDTVAALGYEIIEVGYAKKYDAFNLTVYIWNKAGITLDDCEKVHLAIDPILDELDPTGGKPYVLNVSSPGLDRPIVTERDYERALGTDVEVKLYAPLKGKKLFEGKLTAATPNKITIVTKDGEVELEMTRIAVCRPLIKF